MSLDAENLYRLLPAVYRLRDEEQGRPLKALLSVIAEQAAAIEEDLEQLYDDQFIETCADWVVPYIGDLIGYRGLHGVTAKVSSPRAEVANTIGYRRRKGTASVLEQLAADVTGWNARVVEFFQLVATTQYLKHLRPHHRAVADLRRQATLQLLGGPYDQIAHTANVRRISSGGGRHNIPNVGLFLWRLRPHRVTRGEAKLVKEGCYTFHPLGLDSPLFNLGRSEETIEHVAEPVNAPDPLHRRVLYEEVEVLRQALADGKAEPVATRALAYFNARSPVIEIFKGTTAIPPKEMLICDLSDWRRPPNQRSYRPTGKRFNDGTPDPTLPIQVAVDPVLGRLAFPTGTNLTNIRITVSYCYGFSDDMGGGPYRKENLVSPVSARVSAGGSTLPQALTTVGTTDGVIQIDDSSTITGDVTITLGPQQDLVIQANEGTRPVMTGAVTIVSAPEAEVTLNGILFAKMVRITGAHDVTLTLRHCTVSPMELAPDLTAKPLATPSIRWNDAGGHGALVLDRTISGRIVAGRDVRVGFVNSLVDAVLDGGVALAGSEDGREPAGMLRSVDSTVLGSVHVSSLESAEQSLFLGPLISDQTQKGCVRFSYLPLESQVSRRYRCQPDFAMRQAMDEAASRHPDISASELEQIAARTRTRVQPVWTSRQFGQAGYGQLHGSCPVEVRTGAEDGSEMGVFHQVFQSQRESNLRTRLAEYLRLGLEANVLYVT
jgi:hypothetical protein